MASYTATTRYLLRKITGGSDRAEIDDGIGALADDIDANMAGYAQGTLAARDGLTATAGKLYRTTDTGQVFMGTGSAWIEIGVSPWVPGDLKLSWLTTAPAGWLVCDGAAVSRATYAGLFAAISTSAGAGDLSTTFNVPDFRGRVFVMPDGSAGRLAFNDTRGIASGAEFVTLTANEVPDLPVVGVNAGGAPPSNIGPGAIRGDQVIGGGGSNYSLATTNAGAFSFYLMADGGGAAHSNMQPTMIGGSVLVKT